MRSISSSGEETHKASADPIPRHGDLNLRFDALRAKLLAPGVTAGAQDGAGRRWTRAGGLADVGSGVPMTPATPMRIGSITKSFTAAAVLVLVERGAVELESPAVDYLPELRALDTNGHPLEAVTIRSLLLHRSGLLSEPPTRRWFEPPFPSIDSVLEHIDMARIAIPPGKAFKYSNLGYALLGEVVARVSGQPYERFLAETVYEPADLTETTFEEPTNAARGYANGPNGSWIEQEPQEFGAERAGGGLWSTAGDLLRWAEVSAGRVPEVLSSATVALLTDPQTVEHATSGRGHALGWEVSRVDGRTLHGHGGGVNGFTCHLAFDLLAGNAAVVLTNGHAMPDATHLGTLGVERPAPESLASPPGVGQSLPSLRDPVGEYTGALDLPARIEERGDGSLWLVGGLLDEPAGARLGPHDHDSFQVNAGRFAGETLTLERTPDGEIIAFTIADWRHPRV